MIINKSLRYKRSIIYVFMYLSLVEFLTLSGRLFKESQKNWVGLSAKWVSKFQLGWPYHDSCNLSWPYHEALISRRPQGLSCTGLGPRGAKIPVMNTYAYWCT